MPELAAALVTGNEKSIEALDHDLEAIPGAMRLCHWMKAATAPSWNRLADPPGLMDLTARRAWNVDDQIDPSIARQLALLEDLVADTRDGDGDGDSDGDGGGTPLVVAWFGPRPN